MLVKIFIKRHFPAKRAPWFPHTTMYVAISAIHLHLQSSAEIELLRLVSHTVLAMSFSSITSFNKDLGRGKTLMNRFKFSICRHLFAINRLNTKSNNGKQA